jgi:hypothetical protein
MRGDRDSFEINRAIRVTQQISIQRKADARDGTTVRMH